MKAKIFTVILGVVALVVCAVAYVYMTNHGVASSISVVKEGGYLGIPIADVKETASFYPVEVDGVRMEVIAVKASDGSIRTSFNTCQSCFASGNGFYKTDGKILICQNCGFRFTPDQVEVRSGGCNPFPIFASNKRIIDGEIQIPYNFLREHSEVFSAWRNI